MTARVLISCNGKTGGKQCNGSTALSPISSAAKAREKAATMGWSHEPQYGDLCPICTNRLRRDRARRGAT
jgi:hypothetical protein